MNKVFIVSRVYYHEGSIILRIYDSLDKAESYVAEYLSEDYPWGDLITIEEFAVNGDGTSLSQKKYDVP